MTRTKEYLKLNTTGTCFEHVPTTTYYSYRTPIYQEFCTRKGKLKVFNDTLYSATTRKHQNIVRKYSPNPDIVLHHCPFGYWGLDTGLKNEITMTEYKLKELNNKTRKLGKRQAELKEYLTKRLQELRQLYAEV